MKNNKHSNYKLQIALFLFIITLLFGCNLSKGVNSILNKKVKPQYYSFEDKSIIFTPLTHFGQKEYYESLKDSLTHWKKNGYIVFYERITRDRSILGLDSISYDTLQRKFRKIDGGYSGTAEDYAEDLQKVFKKGVAQPEYKELGIDNFDINVDITLVDLINKTEEYYGKIELKKCDYATHIDSSYACDKGLKLKKLEPIYVDFRNKVVVEKIINTEMEKIVVLYGLMHIKGMIELLNEE